MAVTVFSPLLGLALPTTGDLTGTWGQTVNDSITSLLDSAVAGTTTLILDTDVTLSTSNGAANQARNAVILWSATGTATRYITAPAHSKAYIVINATGGTQSIVIRGVGPTTGVTIAAGVKALVAWDGTDFVKISTSQVNLASEVTGTLATGNGGTGLTTFGGANKAIFSTSASGLTADTLPIAAGGTGQTTKNNAFNALSPIAAKGDLIAGSGASTASNLAVGADGYALLADAAATLGMRWGTTVSSINATVPSFLSVSGVPIATSGTIAITYSDTPLPIANGGTGATSSAAALSSLNAQATLVSGTNIKTINGISILGSGDLPVQVFGTSAGKAFFFSSF